MDHTWQNDKKPYFGSDFGPFWPKCGPKNFFLWVLTLLDVTRCKLSLYEISGETNETNLRKWQKKTSFRPDFSPFGPNLGPKEFFMDFTCTRC